MADLPAALREELSRLRGELIRQPQFRRYEMISALLADYESENDREEEKQILPATRNAERTPGVHQRFVRSDDSKQVQWIAGAVNYLREIRRRAQSPDIQRALVEAGLMEPGIAARRVLSSYLSREKQTFDNVPGQGYGLREWTLEPKPEVPIGSTRRDATSNGRTTAMS
jgi:hypothetical protein